MAPHEVGREMEIKRLYVLHRFHIRGLGIGAYLAE
jgi:hypothetical protein